MDIRQLLLFKLNDKDFAVEIEDVLSIVPVAHMVKIPDTPDYIEGLINLRGSIHTIFNLRSRFGMPAASFDDNSRIIIVNRENESIGFLADKVNEIIRVDNEHIGTTPQSLEGIDGHFISGIAEKDDRTIMILNLPAILDVEVRI